MSVKNFGIYIAYPPTVDLRDQGLGRYLASFLKGAQCFSDVRFTICCPSWYHESIDQLFDSEGVPRHLVDIVSPQGVPILLRIFNYKKLLFSGKALGLYERVKNSVIGYLKNVKQKAEILIAGTNSWFIAIPLFALFILLGLFLLPLVLVFFIFRWLAALSKIVLRKIYSTKFYDVHRMLSSPKDNSLILRFFTYMENAESERMLRLANSMNFISAWYCPTAFWPAFHEIKKPKLMCLPDIVFSEFPTAFAQLSGERTLTVFNQIHESVLKCSNFVTYSQNVKWTTLVDQYGIPAEKISVVNHAPSLLNHKVDVLYHPEENREEISQVLCRDLLRSAFSKSSNVNYADGYDNWSVDYLFYASQFRPNKNVISLLRAYKYLLRERYVSIKLILTGNPDHAPEIKKFIKQNFLEKDVLCLSGLTVSELAACYKMAKLAVNPSLSEGGCPFTFTEALSVGTPVVTARIAVAEEVLKEADLQDATFFDPYDWRAMAEKIEWALDNREHLLYIQKRYFDKLKNRTWNDVVAEHISVLEKISQEQN